MILLSILIPSLPEREASLTELFIRLTAQIYDTNYKDNIEILIDKDPGKIGAKRNRLLDKAQGMYIAFFDDDDLPGKTYISTLIKGIATNPDCISLVGTMTTDGTNPEAFEHSIIYSKYMTVEGAKFPEIKYLRYPNHLNCIRASIAKQFKFPEINHGEDTAFATAIYNSGLLKNEFRTREVIYFYQYNSKK